MPDVVVIGGGITGLAAAYECARAGATVTLLEARRLGAMASSWTLGGVRQSGRDPAELPLARAAVARWGTLADELGGDTGYRRRGNLRLARSEAEVAVIRAMVETQRALGLDLDFLANRSAIAAIAPAVGAGVLAASFCPGDGHADPDRTLAAYAGAARRLGVEIREGAGARRLLVRGGRVTGATTPAGEITAAVTILAAGIHTPELLAPLGIGLPLAVKRVLVLQTEPVAPSFEQVFGVANADCAGRQEIDGRFRITTGIGDWPGDPAAWSEETLRPGLADCAALIQRTLPLLPVLGQAGLHRTWGGLIDLTPDALPVLDAPETHPGLVIGAGFSGHGFGIGPVSGAILAALAMDRTPDFDLSPFRLNRFASDPRFAALTLHG